MNEMLNLVKAHYAIYGRRPTGREMWVRLLAGLTAQQVAIALDMHAKASQFPALPADVLRLAQPPDESVVSADEAWAIALKASDERNTVVWTEAMAQAFGIAKEVLDRGDEVGARMAFREAYKRMSGEHAGPPAWKASLGHDADKRRDAIEEAVSLGRLTREYAGVFLQSLPPPQQARQRLLGSDNTAAMALSAITERLPAEEAHQRIKAIKRELARSVAVEDQRDRVAAIIAKLPENQVKRRDAIESLDPATKKHVRHVLGELEKARQSRLLQQRLLAEANENYSGVRIGGFIPAGRIFEGEGVDGHQDMPRSSAVATQEARYG